MNDGFGGPGEQTIQSSVAECALIGSPAKCGVSVGTEKTQIC